MRWADLGPTPGRQRSASIRSSRAVGDFISFGQNGSFIPGGRPRPPVKADIFSLTAASTLRAASLTAAATRSSSMSLSSASKDGSMLTRLTSCLQVIVTLTMPAPDCPSTSIEASSSWSLRMCSCICWACLIKPAICAFIEISPSPYGLDRGLDDGCVEILDQVAYERVPADCRSRSVAGGVGGFPDRHGQAHGLAEALLQCPAKFFLVILFRQMLRSRRHAKLEGFAVEAPEFARLSELFRDTTQIERIGEFGPIAVERRPGNRLPIPRRPCRFGGLLPCRAVPTRFAGVARSRGKGEHAQERHREAGEFVRRKRKILPSVNRDLIVELDLLRVEGPAESDQSLAQPSFCIHGVGRRLSESDAVQESTEILERAVEPDATGSHVLRDRQHRGRIAASELFEDRIQEAVVDRAEHRAHGLLRDVSGAVRDRLIEKRQCGAHAPARTRGQQPERPGFAWKLLLREYGLEVSRDRARRHLLEVELQAAGEHRHRDLLGVGRRKDELDVFGRLLESLQHRVERRRGEHVDFVDDVYLESPTARCVYRVLQELAHLVDLGVGRGIDFYQVDEAPRVDFHAGRTLPAGTGADARLAIEAFREDPGEGRLAHTAGPGKQVRVVQPILIQRVAQRLDDVLLPDQRLERAGTPLASEDLVRHGRILTAVEIEEKGFRIEDSGLRGTAQPRARFLDPSSQILNPDVGGEPYPRHLQ